MMTPNLSRHSPISWGRAPPRAASNVEGQLLRPHRGLCARRAGGAATCAVSLAGKEDERAARIGPRSLLDQHLGPRRALDPRAAGFLSEILPAPPLCDLRRLPTFKSRRGPRC